MEAMIHKFSAACHAIRWMGHVSNINTLKSTYYAYFHSIIKYGKIFGGMTLPTVGRFTKVNCHNYGRCTTESPLYKSI